MIIYSFYYDNRSELKKKVTQKKEKKIKIDEKKDVIPLSINISCVYLALNCYSFPLTQFI
jgi:hypothetical protein